MRLLSRLLIGSLALLAGAGIAVAQQPATPSPQEQADRLALELAYVEREHKQCRGSLADLWARGNALEAQVKQLQEKLKTLEDTAGAAPITK